MQPWGPGRSSDWAGTSSLAGDRKSSLGDTIPYVQIILWTNPFLAPYDPDALQSLPRDSITREEVERCKDRDLLENMLAEMAGEFPALSR